MAKHVVTWEQLGTGMLVIIIVTVGLAGFHQIGEWIFPTPVYIPRLDVSWCKFLYIILPSDTQEIKAEKYKNLAQCFQDGVENYNKRLIKLRLLKDE